MRETRKRTLWQHRLVRLFELPDYVIIIVIVLLAVSFRIIYYLQLMANSPCYNLLIHDSALFNELAHTVLNKGLVLDQPFYISPLYIYFLAVIYKVLGSTIDMVRCIQFGLGVGTAVLTFAIGKTFFGKKVGSLAGLLAAVYAPFLFFEGNLLGTVVATFCLTASLFCLVYANPKWNGYLMTFASGLFLALSITGRPNLLLLVPIPVLFLFLNRSRLGKASFVFAGLMVVGIAIPIGLTGLHNYHAGGQFNLLTTHGGINFYIGNHENASGTWEAPEGIEASVSAINLVESKRFAEEATNKELTASQVSRFWYKRALSFIINHLVQWGGLLIKKFLMFWSGYEAPINFDYYFHQRYSSLLKFPLLNLAFYMPLAILGLILFAQKWREYWILYATIGISCVSIVMFFMGDRYRIVVMPLLIIMASAGIVRFFD